MALLRGLRAAAARLPRRPPPSTTRPWPRRALTSSKERSKTSRENVSAWKSDQWHRYGHARASGVFDERRKDPILNAVLGAAVALFFGGGIYAILKKPLSVTPDPTDVVNQRYTGWRKKFTDEELEWLGDKRPTKAQEAAILAARRQAYTPIAEIVAAAPVVVFSAEGCPYCDEAKAELTDASIDFKEVAASDWQREQLTKLTGSRTVPQVFVGGEFVGGCHDGGLGGTIPLLRMGLLQAMAAQAADERDRAKQASHAVAGDELARLRRQLAAEKKGD